MRSKRGDAGQDEEICARSASSESRSVAPTESGACASQCLHDLAIRICYQETLAAQRCVIAVGAEGVTCMNGRTFLKAGTCEPEKGALTTCLLGTRADAGCDWISDAAGAVRSGGGALGVGRR